jgi:hypothetical protein
MEILNVTTIEAGWDAFYIFMGSVICFIALLLFIYIITEWYKDKAYMGFLIFLLYPLALTGLGIVIMRAGHEPVTYNKYDVVFTDTVNLDKLGEQYIIKGHDGRIWHLEDKH